ncbi:MAG: 23S rRNA (uracil(1939)-C(5))-methyltransferase RlmD [Pygmaiobacter massiliensis]|nr:23S rRNA (uracil(1939)-C(5))-methyltransferase RlmD [Pygmaiobacter massiliensis]
MKKNEIVELTIDSICSDGNGIGRVDGMAVFVPFTAPGDRCLVKIVKVLTRYAFGICTQLLVPAKGRVAPDCPAFGRCGGCSLRHLSYEAELCAKQKIVADAFCRLGNLQVQVAPCLPSPNQNRYRNKVQYPFLQLPDGSVGYGFYALRSHRAVPCSDCLLQPKLLNQLAELTCQILTQFGVSVYDEQTHRGVLRHLYLRQGAHSGQIMVCLVINANSLPCEQELVRALTQTFSAVRTILICKNREIGNVILGTQFRTIYGDGIIEDTLCGVPVALAAPSFYQVNTPGAEQLYQVARRLAAPKKDELLLDLYCGTGTIGLSMAADCGRLIGVEVVPEAVESARTNAARMGISHAEFFCADAGQAAAQLARQGLRPNVVVLDPPRKGCDKATLDALVRMSPDRIVMVSCNPATAARDVRTLAENGYLPGQVQPVDMFPRTRHVETVCLMSRKEK